MAEDRKILHIADTLSSIDIGQLGYETIVDTDLNFKMWGGKDADGNVTKWLAKDKAVQVTTATLTGGTTSGSSGLIRHDSAGLLSGGAISLAALNALISDATLFGEEDFDANTILKADSDDTPITLTVPEQTIVGRITAGVIDALTPSEVIAMIESTLDDAYNQDAGAAVITVDAGDVIWDMTGAYFFEIDLTNTTAGTPNGDVRRGFKVFNAADFFKVVTDGSTIDLDAELDQIDINAAGVTSLSGTGVLDLSYSNIDLSASTLTIEGTTKFAGGIKHNTTTVNAATYDLLITDYNVSVTYTTTGPVTSLTLPTAQTEDGREITIGDAGGNASINNIKIDTEGSELIN